MASKRGSRKQEDATTPQKAMFPPAQVSAGAADPEIATSPLSHYARPAPLKWGPLSEVIGIGWNVSNGGISVGNPRHVAAVAIARQRFGKGEEKPGTAAKVERTYHRTYAVDVRGPHATRDRVAGPVAAARDQPVLGTLPWNGSEMSGLLGLLSPWQKPDDSAERTNLERAISEVLMWGLHVALEEATGTGGRVAILLQGPLLPKLRGRIYYRMLDVGRTPLYVVTSDPRWLARATALPVNSPAERSVRGKEARDQSGNRDSGEYDWTNAAPDLALDSASREFVGWRLGKPAAHIEVPGNAIGVGRAKDFFDKCPGDFSDLFRGSVECEAHARALLPRALAEAIEAATEAVREKLTLLRGVERAWARLLRVKEHSEAPSAPGISVTYEAFKRHHPDRLELAANNAEATPITSEEFRDLLAGMLESDVDHKRIIKELQDLGSESDDG